MKFVSNDENILTSCAFFYFSDFHLLLSRNISEMDSVVGESIENSVKSVQLCEASSAAEKMSVPVDEEPEDVDVVTDRVADGEHDSGQVNGLSHNVTTENAVEANSSASIDASDATNTNSPNPHCIQSLEENGDGAASAIDEETSVQEESVATDADHDDTNHRGVEHVNAIEDDHHVDADRNDASDKEAEGTANINTVR